MTDRKITAQQLAALRRVQECGTTPPDHIDGALRRKRLIESVPRTLSVRLTDEGQAMLEKNND